MPKATKRKSKASKGQLAAMARARAGKSSLSAPHVIVVTVPAKPLSEESEMKKPIFINSKESRNRQSACSMSRSNRYSWYVEFDHIHKHIMGSTRSEQKLSMYLENLDSDTRDSREPYSSRERSDREKIQPFGKSSVGIIHLAPNDFRQRQSAKRSPLCNLSRFFHKRQHPVASLRPGLELRREQVQVKKEPNQLDEQCMADPSRDSNHLLDQARGNSQTEIDMEALMIQNRELRRICNALENAVDLMRADVLAPSSHIPALTT